MCCNTEYRNEGKIAIVELYTTYIAHEIILHIYENIFY